MARDRSATTDVDKDATPSEGRSPAEARSAHEKEMEAVEKRGITGGPDVKLPADSKMALFSPPAAELDFVDREPDKVIPPEGSDGADTPSGYALREVGAPDPLDAGSEAERDKGLQYRVLKYMKRWMS
jgi:hypothetical protein